MFTTLFPISSIELVFRLLHCLAETTTHKLKIYSTPFPHLYSCIYTEFNATPFLSLADLQPYTRTHAHMYLQYQSSAIPFLLSIQRIRFWVPGANQDDIHQAVHWKQWPLYCCIFAEASQLRMKKKSSNSC